MSERAGVVDAGSRRGYPANARPRGGGSRSATACWPAGIASWTSPPASSSARSARSSSTPGATRGRVRSWPTAVRAVTGLPLVVAVTHAHFDHCFGTGAFLPCPVFAHPRCRATLAATADAQRAEWVTHYRDHGAPDTAGDLAATEPPLPDHAVDPETSLDLGGRTVTLRHLGRGHTDHDLVVHVPDAAVVFAGDLVEQGAPPDLGDAVLAEWPATLDTLLALRPAVVVPGPRRPGGRGVRRRPARRGRRGRRAARRRRRGSNRHGHRRTTLALPQPALGRRGPG